MSQMHFTSIHALTHPLTCPAISRGLLPLGESGKPAGEFVRIRISADGFIGIL